MPLALIPPSPLDRALASFTNDIVFWLALVVVGSWIIRALGPLSHRGRTIRIGRSRPLHSTPLSAITLRSPLWLLLGSCAAIILGALLVLFADHKASNVHLVRGCATGILVGTPVFLFSALIARLIHHRRLQSFLHYARSLESLRSVPWDTFEDMVGESFRRQGFRVRGREKGGPDGGVDILLEKDGSFTVVQCKRYRSKVIGVTTVRELLGVMVDAGAAHGILVTTSYFSRDAFLFAAGKPIRLLGAEEVVEMLSPRAPRRTGQRP